MISQNTIDKIKDLDILDVIGKYISIEKKGTDYKSLCPFHEEKTPSFSINTSKQFYHCFGCGAGGDTINFVMEKYGLSYPLALERIAQDHGIRVEYETQTPKENEIQINNLININRAAAIQYFNQLLDTNGNHPAFKELIDKRLYTAETIIQWRLGYAPGTSVNGQFNPKEWQFLSNKLIEKGLFKDAESIGLVQTKDNKNYDTFRHRLMFPIYDEKSRLVGFGGRALGDYDKSKTPKYLNSINTDVFNKSTVLYGLNFALQSIRKQDFAYIVEGYTDVISFHQAGITNTVGTAGTALTKEHVKLLSRYTKNIVLAYDPDVAGKKKMITTTDLLLEHGCNVQIVGFPINTDPDEFARLNSHLTANELIKLHVDAIEYKAGFLLSGANELQRDDLFNNVARSIAMLHKPVREADIGKKIAKAHGIDWSLFKQLIASHTEIVKKKEQLNGVIRKNKVVNLDTEAHIYPFFDEKFDREGAFKGVEINRYKLRMLLKSKGFYCYEMVGEDNYIFVQITSNLIEQVQRNFIIKYIEKFLENEYDFDGAKCSYSNAEVVINKFLGSLNSYFSKDQLGMLVPDEPILVNKDTKDACYFYYQNGFVEITKEGRYLYPYEKMNGSIWEQQTLPRDFKQLDDFVIDTEANTGTWDTTSEMYDFVYKLANQDNVRFYSLCSIIGYLVHDYYEYKLRSPLFTDSTISDKSEGRTGKTLLLRLIGQVRSYCEINGKNFDANDKKKYEEVKIDTQIVHLNDIKHTGRNRFNFEDIFNDITEGFIVDGKYMTPYRKQAKYAISSNRTINIQGASQIDRVVEFELSGYFNINRSPEQEYGKWLMRDWSTEEWNKYDNFMCMCAQLFLRNGIIMPGTINLEMRKLKDHTSEDFLEFMKEIEENIEKIGVPWSGYYENSLPLSEETKIEFTGFIFDKKKLYKWFLMSFPDWDNNNFSQRKFTNWLQLYGELKIGPNSVKEWRSHGVGYLQFLEE